MRLSMPTPSASIEDAKKRLEAARAVHEELAKELKQLEEWEREAATLADEQQMEELRKKIQSEKLH